MHEGRGVHKTDAGGRGSVASAKIYAGKWAYMVQERGARGSGNGEAQVAVGTGAPAQAGVRGRTSSIQVRGAASVGLCMAQDGASAGGRAVLAQEGTAHGSAGKRGRLGSSDEREDLRDQREEPRLRG